MPTYEYECLHCGYNFEIFQPITAKPVKGCPKCSKQVKRLISPGAGIIFKGPGFYATDYRKKEKKETASNACPKAKEGCNACPAAQ